MCLCREKIHAALFLPAACSESIESHRFETIIEARRNDLEKKSITPEKKYKSPDIELKKKKEKKEGGGRIRDI